MKDMILFPEDIERLNAVLSQLAIKANLLLAVLINKDGRMLTSQGSLEKIDTVSLAALVAGNSASTLAIANLMGETEFSTMYHQGKDKNIYIALVDDNTFISLVFDDRTNIDRVKVFARQFDRQLKETLALVYNKNEEDIDLDLDMNAFSGAPGGIADGQNFFNSPSIQNQMMNQEWTGIPQEQMQMPRSPGTPEEVAYIELGKKNGGGDPNSELQHQRTGEEGIFEIQNNSGVQIPPGASADTPDTKYLYLQKKIRESVKRKSNTEPPG